MTLRQAQNIRSGLSAGNSEARIIRRSDWPDSYEIVFSTEEGGSVVLSERCIKHMPTTKLSEYTSASISAIDGDFIWIGRPEREAQ